MKRLFRPATVLFLVIWVGLLVGGRSRFFQDAGTFWHTVVGERILDSGFFDRDPYTFTFDGQPWIPHQWLGECAMALAKRVGGFDTELLLTCTLLAAVYAWIGSRLIRSGLHWSLTSVFVALALMASSGHFHIRPHLATIALFAVTFAFLTDYEGERISTRGLCWLIPVFLIWTNAHGGMLGGLATFVLAILGWVVIKRLGWWSPLQSFTQFLALVGIVAVCLATVFVNPWGARLPEVWFEIYQSKLLPQIIAEHARLDPAALTGMAILAFGLVYIVLLVSTFPEKPRVSWLLPLVWFALACLRVRHAPLFAVSAAIAIADLFPYTRFASRWEKSNNDLYTRQPDPPAPVPLRERLVSWVVPAGAVLLALVLQWFRVPVPVIGHGWARLDPKVWPLELVEDLRAHENDSDRPKIFNEYTFGGFLIYHAPGYRVFVDDRCELFGDDWLAEFVLAGSTPDYQTVAEYLREWQRVYGPFDFALTSNGSHFDACLRQSPYWEMIRPTETANFYRRRK